MRDVKGYEGLYAVTSCGKVWSYKSDRFLSPCKTKSGYMFVRLCKNGKVKNMFVHRLVAQTYVENKKCCPVINHKDENPLNNNVNNLEWCTIQYNINYGSHNENVSKSKNKPCICIELDKIYKSPLVASKELGIHYSRVTQCCRDCDKSVNGYHFKYV